MDLDCNVTLGDVNEFIAVLLVGEMDINQCHTFRADMNDDGELNGLDLQLFLDEVLIVCE
jgi:hypothetical protein